MLGSNLVEGAPGGFTFYPMLSADFRFWLINNREL